eukprot:gene34716-44431_t
MMRRRQKAVLKEIFDIFDQDRSGTIHVDELRPIYEALAGREKMRNCEPCSWRASVAW